MVYDGKTFTVQATDITIVNYDRKTFTVQAAEMHLILLRGFYFNDLSTKFHLILAAINAHDRKLCSFTAVKKIALFLKISQGSITVKPFKFGINSVM